MNVAEAAIEAVKFCFPYQDLLSISRSAVTPWFVLGIVAYFSASVLYLFRQLRSLGDRLDEHSEDVSIERIGQDHLLRELWWLYEQSFLTRKGERQKTELDAADLFDEYSVLSRQVNVRYWTAVPGILLALGIFGTFLGLTLGIAGFDTSNPGTIQASIQTLLAGMGTAFLTSLWGMACSVGFNIIEKGLFKRVTDNLSAFCRTLDVRYKLSRGDLLRFEREDREQFLRQLLVPESGGNEVMPGEVLRELLANSAQQTITLELFSRILDASLRISTETLELRGRIKATIEETKRAGISQDELDGFLEEMVRVVQDPLRLQQTGTDRVEI